jgi:hypothetical protein
MKSTPRHQAFLVKLIRTLVEEWGCDDVQKALAQVSNTGGHRVSSGPGKGVARQPSPNREAGRSKKLTAVEQVARLSIPDRERETLFVIAAKFDRKEFLPSVVDIREFLAMRGDDSSGVKDRLDGFRRLLRSLSQLPSDKLEGLASSTRYSGPAQLGPLSDAIRSTGEEIRRKKRAPEPEQKS